MRALYSLPTSLIFACSSTYNTSLLPPSHCRVLPCLGVFKATNYNLTTAIEGINVIELRTRRMRWN